MRITIEDLEALKELSDELEENHVETEKQLYEDIGALAVNLYRCLSIPFVLSTEQRDTLTREYHRKIDSLEEACLDYDGTIQQFRELVMQLQK